MHWDLKHGGQLQLLEDFVAEGERGALFEALRREVPFRARQIRIMGREVWQPRLCAWVGDPAAAYTYSGVRNEPAPWTQALAELRARISAAAHEAFNSVLCNLYRDGADSMGFHADAEPELGPEPVIASLSLGAVRRFQLRARRNANEPAAAQHDRLDLDLPDGSLLLMRGSLQQHYRHGIPKQPRVHAPRINLTFRRILANTVTH